MSRPLQPLFFGLCLLLAFSCKKDQDLSDKPDSLPYFQPFSAQSPFYDTIPSNAAIDANSSVMVGSLVDQASQGFVLGVREWTVSVYYTDASTPTYDVKLTAGWAPKNKLLDVPIPDWAEPDPAGDGHMVILDTLNGCAYDFWEARWASGGWKASWANAISLSSDGIFPEGLSARGSGFELLQGMVWPDELANGEIPHALLFSYDHTKDGGPVSPATESDGTSSDAWAIPEGARVQLNPALDLDSLGLNAYEKTIATALQRYGMFCGDDGGGLSLYAINPNSVSINPYTGILPNDALVDLSKIPADQFRVLELPVQVPEPAWGVVPDGCNRFD